MIQESATEATKTAETTKEFFGGERRRSEEEGGDGDEDHCRCHYFRVEKEVVNT